MTWIIRHKGPGKGRAKYLAHPGSAKTYIPDGRKARRFPTREAALAECNDDETPEEL